MQWKKSLSGVVLVMMIVSAVPAGADTDHPGHEPPGSERTIVQNEWHGFISCGVGSPILVGEMCTQVDENADFLHLFSVDPGMKTLVVGMEWDALTPLADSLQINLEEEGSGLGSTPIAGAEGGSPLEFRLDEGEDFDPLTTEWDLQFRVFPPFEPTLVFQQTFSVHYHEFYGEHAPAGYSALAE